jgi:predicted phage terminase large subunit-like protein
MRFVRLNVESNDRVKEVFPFQELAGRVYGLEPSAPWGEDQLTVRNNRHDGAPSMYAVGLGGSISGIRADVIVVDDLIDQNNVMTDTQRNKIDEFWDTVVTPTLNPGGRIFLVGTRYHAKDFYSRRGEYRLDEQGQPISYWPSRWPTYELLRMKERMGSLAFNSQYMCDPSGYAGQLFDPEHIHFYHPKTLASIWGDLDFIMSVDPNVTEDPESDNTAIITAAVDRKRGQLYVLDVYAKPLGFVNQVKQLKQHGTRTQIKIGDNTYPVDIKITKIGVEAVAYQRSLQQTGYLMGLPVVEVKQGNRNKEVRILGMQPHFENGRIRLPDPDVVNPAWYDKFFEEYCTFPKGRRDDIMDALEILVSMVSSSFGVSGIPWGPGEDYVASRRFRV